MDRIRILPPLPGTCRVCAARHAKDAPHERDSLYYQVHFYKRWHRWPTWEDAMAHCSDEEKKAKRAELAVRLAPDASATD